MNKLLITRGAELEGQEYIRFDIRSENLEDNRWACLKVKQSKEMTPYQSFEIEEEMIISSIGNVVDLLNAYLYEYQRDRK